MGPALKEHADCLGTQPSPVTQLCLGGYREAHGPDFGECVCVERSGSGRSSLPGRSGFQVGT